jgi:hypothetical protein
MEGIEGILFGVRYLPLVDLAPRGGDTRWPLGFRADLSRKLGIEESTCTQELRGLFSFLSNKSFACFLCLFFSKPLVTNVLLALQGNEPHQGGLHDIC